MSLRRRSYLLEAQSGKIRVVWGNYVKNLKRYIDDLMSHSKDGDWEMWNGRFPTYFRQDMIDAQKRHFARYSSFDEYAKQAHGKERVRKETVFVVRESQKNVREMVARLDKAVGSIDAWSGSNLQVVPSYEKDSIDPISAVSVDLYKGGSVGKMAPGFTLFYDSEGGKIEVDDVLDAGDTDFFKDPEIESDYFMLVQELKHPGSSRAKSSRPILLYTARPIADRARYDRAVDVPRGIFLTTDADRAYGLGVDLGGSKGRDVYRVKIDPRYLIKTLDAGRVKEYQVVAQMKDVPVISIDRIS